MYKNAFYFQNKFEVFLLSDFFIIFFTGFVFYPLLEILWRGYTHPVMALAGGICFTIIYYINIFLKRNIFICSLLCAASITAVEFVTGCICNLLLKMNIWDYSGLSYNLCGQICPQYFILWLLLSFLLSPLCSFFRSFIFL